jgi:hypothetical protein
VICGLSTCCPLILSQASHLFDLASCCAILFPIVWSIQQLKTETRSAEVAAAASDAAEDPDAMTSDAPAMKEKLLQLRGFYSQVQFSFAWETLCVLTRMSGCSVSVQHQNTFVFSQSRSGLQHVVRYTSFIQRQSVTFSPCTLPWV